MQFATLRTIVSNITVTLRETHSIAKALEEMSKHSISSIVIVDEKNRPIGIFTEHDALRIVSEMIDQEIPLSKVMTRNPFCVEQSQHLHDAYMMMEEKAYRHLVIVDEVGEFVGIVSEGDFLRHMGFDALNRFKTVAEAMSNAPLVIQSDVLMITVAKLMKEHKCDYAIVIENMCPIGLITERDIIYSHEDMQGKAAEKLLNHAIKTIKQNLLLHEAAELMKEHSVHQLVVVDDNEHLSGVLNRHDILKAVHGSYFEFLVQLINQKNDTIAQLQERKKELRAKKDLLEESTIKYRKLFEAIPDGTVLLDVQTLRAVEFNSAAHEYLGYSAEEFSKLSISDYEIIESPEETQRRIGVIKSQGYDIFETKHRTKEGKIIDVWVNAVAVEISGQNYIIAVYRDITVQKETQENFAQQSSFLQSLLKNIPDLVWLKDLDGVYLACNEMFERLYNAKESEIIGKDDFDFVDTELATFFREHDKAAVAAGGSRTNEEFLVFGDGSYQGFFETVKTPMKDIHGNVIGVLGIARDISERKAKDDESANVQALAHVGTWSWDILKDEFIGSSEGYRIFGIPQGEKVGLKDVLKRFSSQDRARVQEQLLNTSRTKQQVGSLYRLNVQDGDDIWIKTHTEFQYNEKHQPIKAAGIFQDVSEQIRHEKELQKKDEDLSAAQAIAHIGSWRLKIKDNILEWSDETYRIFGIEIGAPLTYEMFLERIHPEDAEKVALAWQRALEGEKYDIEHRIIVDGTTKWVHEQAKLNSDKAGNILDGIGMVQEITQRKLYEQKLETLANYDPLTGLANRGLLVSYLQKIIEGAKRNKSQIALLMFDLDRFKDINDSYGHNAGDELLQQVAKRFSSRLREGDLISRLGGDEFAVVMNNFTHPEDAGRLAEEMIETLSMNYQLSAGVSVHIGASVGIVIFPDHASDAQTLLQYADAALYKSKSEGRATYRYYSDELTQSARKRIECETNLRLAITNKEFEVYYQPQVHIASGRIIGAEALIRWNNPKRGLVSPAEFIPVAGDTGLIGEIGEWVLNETCRQGKIWLNQGHRLTLAVNLSAHQIRYQDVVSIVEKAIKQSGFEANRLELELTESALMQREEETVEILHSLRAKGIRLAIDDFGTGYSSLSYLKRFPIDILKIDKSFVDDVPYDADDNAIVSAIIAMGQALGFQVLAEGVEQEEQLRFLEEKGCTMYQGYYKSKPLPAKEFEKLLK